ncbi:MAG TPA: ABC transporter ATP-binding protein [Thermomicrobiaceae bacterium]|nr:ABC transporter ATP-binding protein [Thermomicrobiaceae bacterium]
MDAAIVTEQLTKMYGTVVALDGLDLRVERGEIFGFLGPNGAGKTTTIRLLLDLIRPTSGRATVLGHDCRRESRSVRASIGYLPGDLRLYGDLTGEQTVRLVSGLRATPPDPAFVRALVAALELDLSPRAAAYSKGNRQKLGLVLAMMSRPPVLLLDEPTSGLDPIMQHVVWELLRAEAGRGCTVFLSSHVLSEVEETCERVGMLRSGRLVAVEPVASLRGRGRRIVVTFAADEPAPDLALAGTRVIERRNHTVALEAAGDLDPLVKSLARYHVVDFRTEQPSLEDVLLGYYREEARR